MIITIEEAREFLRVDGTDNDAIITPLLESIPPYIEIQTGMTEAEQALCPLAQTAAKFLLRLFYSTDQADGEKVQRVIDGILKALTILARE